MVLATSYLSRYESQSELNLNFNDATFQPLESALGHQWILVLAWVVLRVVFSVKKLAAIDTHSAKKNQNYKSPSELFLLFCLDVPACLMSLSIPKFLQPQRRREKKQHASSWLFGLGFWLEQASQPPRCRHPAELVV